MSLWVVGDDDDELLGGRLQRDAPLPPTQRPGAAALRQAAEAAATAALLPRALPASPLVRFTLVSCGSRHVLALTKEHGLFSWGSNGHGQLGDGTLASRSKPVRVSYFDPSTYEVVALACGAAHSAVVARHGQDTHASLRHAVRQTQVGPFSQNLSIAECFTWGCNSAGQLGREVSSDSPSEAPGRVELPAGLDPVPRPSKRAPKTIACGVGHSCLVTADGSLVTWGANQMGQCGRLESELSAGPGLVLRLRDKRVVQVACGAAHTFVITADFVALSFGCNYTGQLGNGRYGDAAQNEPRAITLPVGFDVSQVACGEEFSCALSSAGRLLTWGNGACGQLGHGSCASLRLPKEVTVEALASVECGQGHVIAITRTGKLLTWGCMAGFEKLRVRRLDAQKQLWTGIGKPNAGAESTVVVRSTPSPVKLGADLEGLIAEEKPRAIAAGRHFCVLVAKPVEPMSKPEAAVVIQTAFRRMRSYRKTKVLRQVLRSCLILQRGISRWVAKRRFHLFDVSLRQKGELTRASAARVIQKGYRNRRVRAREAAEFQAVIDKLNARQALLQKIAAAASTAEMRRKRKEKRQSVPETVLAMRRAVIWSNAHP